MSWVVVSVDQFGNVGTPLAVVITAAFVALLAVFPALALWLGARAAPGASRVVAFAGAWLLIEWLRGWALTGFPWLSLGYSQVDAGLAGLAPVGGVYLIGLALAFAAAALAGALRERSVVYVTLLLGAALVWPAAHFSARMQWTQPVDGPFRVAAVQGAIAQEQKWLPTQRWKTLALYSRLSRDAGAADLVVWPETAVPAFFESVADEWLRPLAAELAGQGTTLVVGVPYEPGREYFNALVSFAGGGEQVYAKRHLVPFGEYLPFDAWLRPLLTWLEIPMSRFSAGPDEPPLLDVGRYQAAASICYEDAFGRETRAALPQARFLLNASNDAWFGDSLAPHQHLEIARMRSLETGRWMLRATNTGISAVIDADGRVSVRSPQFAEHVLIADLQPRAGATPYVRFGDWPAVLIALVSFLFGRPWRRTHSAQ